MKLSYADTQALIMIVLRAPIQSARETLHRELTRMKRTEGMFYESIIAHAPGMKLRTDEWFELLSRLPNRVLRSELDLPGILSEEHLRRLPPVSG